MFHSERRPQVGMRQREVWLQSNCLPVFCNGAVQVAFGFHHKTYLVVRLGVARIHTESAPVFSYGAVKIILGHERIAFHHVRGAGICCGWRRRNSQEDRQSRYAQFHKARDEGRPYNTHVAIIKAAGNEHPFIEDCVLLRISLDPASYARSVRDVMPLRYAPFAKTAREPESQIWGITKDKNGKPGRFHLKRKSEGV